MHVFALVILGGTAFIWIVLGLRIAYGALKLPWLKDFPPNTRSDNPLISLLFAARDEEEKLPGALATLEQLDYPELEIIGVDDRSEDATGRILDEFAASHPRLRAIHVKELPAGWLGKPHALQQAYEASSGEWLLFTDADVRFKVDVLRRAITMTTKRNLDHLSLFGDVEMVGFWEKVVVTFFGMAFHMATAPSEVINPKSGAYVGVGAFQLMKRSAYEAAGTHRRLAMEVVDDMKLAKIVKQAGFRSAGGVAQDAVAVRWHAGLGNLIRGTTKNFFAAFGYRLWFAVLGVAAMLAMNVLPFAGLALGSGWIRVFSAIAVLIALGFHVGVDVAMRVSPFYALTHPLGALFFCYMVARSTAVTLWNGGVTWRGTFYRFEEVRRGVV